MNSHSTNNTQDSGFIVPKNKQTNVVEGSVRLRKQINNLEFRQNFFLMKLKKKSSDKEPVVVHAKKMRENKRRKKEEIDSYDNKKEKRETKREESATKAITDKTKTTPHEQNETTGSYLPFLSLPLKPICVDEFVAELIKNNFQLVPDHCLQFKNKNNNN
ncbi:hypothetical protein ABK040_012001 [Willaertia magna]